MNIVISMTLNIALSVAGIIAFINVIGMFFYNCKLKKMVNEIDSPRKGAQHFYAGVDSVMTFIDANMPLQIFFFSRSYFGRAKAFLVALRNTPRITDPTQCNAIEEKLKNFK